MIEKIAEFFRQAGQYIRWQRYWDTVGVDPEALEQELIKSIEDELREKLQLFVGMKMTPDLQRQIEAVTKEFLVQARTRLIYGTPAVQVQPKKKVRLQVEDGRLIRNVDELLTGLDTAPALTITPVGEDRLVVGPPGLAVEGMEVVVDTPELTVHAEPDQENGTYEVTVDEKNEEGGTP